MQREGLDAFDRIGEATSEVVEHRPASLVLVRIVRPKFVRKRVARDDTPLEPGESPVLIADPPERPIERGLAGPGLLAKTIVYRWQETSPVLPRAPRRPTGRRAITAMLPRVEIEVLPPEVQREGLDAFDRIGEETSEVEHRPASLVLVRIVRPKFVRKRVARDDTPIDPDESPVLIAEPPERPIERGLAGPGLLAKTIVYRWQDHLPLYRQEKIHARDGLELARSTSCGWHKQLADLAERLVEAMLRDAFTEPYLCVDATGVLVQAEEQCRRAHFWVLVAPGRHVLYRYSHRHDSEAVDHLLAGYKGPTITCPRRPRRLLRRRATARPRGRARASAAVVPYAFSKAPVSRYRPGSRPRGDQLPDHHT